MIPANGLNRWLGDWKTDCKSYDTHSGLQIPKSGFTPIAQGLNPGLWGKLGITNPTGWLQDFEP